MCVGQRREDEPKKLPEEEQPQAPDEDQQLDYSQMFSVFEAQLIQYRALLMRRLVQDPFYNLMNVSTASRMWMLRYLKHLALLAEQRYNVNLLQFFELMSRDEVLNFFRHKNAPSEMIDMWEKVHPTTGPIEPAPGRSIRRRRYNRFHRPN